MTERWAMLDIEERMLVMSRQNWDSKTVYLPPARHPQLVLHLLLHYTGPGPTYWLPRYHCHYLSSLSLANNHINIQDILPGNWLALSISVWLTRHSPVPTPVSGKQHSVSHSVSRHGPFLISCTVQPSAVVCQPHYILYHWDWDSTLHRHYMEHDTIDTWQWHDTHQTDTITIIVNPPRQY